LAEDRAAIHALQTSFIRFRLGLSEREQRVDDLWLRLEQCARRALGRRRSELERLHRRLAARHPRAGLAASRAELSPLVVRLSSAERALLETARGLVAQKQARLEALSPLAVLARGYAIASTEDGHAIRSADEVALGQEVSVRVHHGRFAAR